MNNYNRNDEMLRVLLDVNRGLNTIERTAVSTDKKVSQMHTILLSKLSPSSTTNHVIVPDVRRSDKKSKQKSPGATTAAAAKKSKKKSPEPRFSFF